MLAPSIVGSKQYQLNITHLDVLLDDVEGFECLLSQKFPNSALKTPALRLKPPVLSALGVGVLAAAVINTGRRCDTAC